MSEDRLKIVERKLQIADDNYTMLEMQLAEVEQKLEKCKAKNKELNALFELQHTQTQKAEHMWRKAFYKSNVIPDLGELVRWLMAEIAELKEFNSECEDRFKLMEGDRDYSQSERLRFKKRIGELLAILEKHGIAND